MESDRDGQLTKVHVNNPLLLFLPTHEEICKRQEHHLFLCPLLSNYFASNRSNMKKHVSPFVVEVAACFLQAGATRKKLSDRNNTIFYKTRLYRVA